MDIKFHFYKLINSEGSTRRYRQHGLQQQACFIFTSPIFLAMTSNLSPNNTPNETPIYTPLESPIQPPTEQTHNPLQDHRPQTPDYYSQKPESKDINAMSGTSCNFQYYFILLRLSRAHILLAVASSTLPTIEPLHNKDPTYVHYTELSTQSRHQKLSEDNQNTGTRQELDGFPKSWGESCWASTNKQDTNQKLRTKGAKGM